MPERACGAYRARHWRRQRRAAHHHFEQRRRLLSFTRRRAAAAQGCGAAAPSAPGNGRLPFSATTISSSATSGDGQWLLPCTLRHSLPAAATASAPHARAAAPPQRAAPPLPAVTAVSKGRAAPRHQQQGSSKPQGGVTPELRGDGNHPPLAQLRWHMSGCTTGQGWSGLTVMKWINLLELRRRM
ncbi:hypothetical protein U9M48_030934 [Paspalum notatum var. saurae]|uniref:Uncharacterized protein n=1 Tax=Paspalum notatum var. saurae TaxID=547442 RepID=A0AAQ3U1T1_PASNO